MDLSNRIAQSFLHSLNGYSHTVKLENVQPQNRAILQFQVNGEEYILAVIKKNPSNADKLLSIALSYAAYRHHDQKITPENYPDDLEPLTKYYDGNGNEEFYLEVGRNSSHYFYAKTDDKDQIWVLSWEPDTDSYTSYKVNSFEEAYLGHY